MQPDELVNGYVFVVEDERCDILKVGPGIGEQNDDQIHTALPLRTQSTQPGHVSSEHDPTKVRIGRTSRRIDLFINLGFGYAKTDDVVDSMNPLFLVRHHQGFIQSTRAVFSVLEQPG
ncbi:hypothetical protein [Caenimonas sedimenti]|uniref:hypothetical protein n=1 Tax=Caenimonas sedimenti TaxID=2596921 RepID=UPI001C956406|nr:hypothetical protein [Caenimonas sedimenti]